jgi:death-on-curing protein
VSGLSPCRVQFVYTFLAINGARFTAGASETEALLLGLYATGTFNFARLRRWLHDNVAFDAGDR